MAVIEEEIRSLLGNQAWKQEFNQINQSKRISARPQDVHHTLKMNLEKLYNGASIRIRAEKKTPCTLCSNKVPCRGCRGTGRAAGKPPTCKMCSGRGYETFCKNKNCRDGQVKEEKYFTVNIPTGALHGQQITLKGQGDALLGDPKTTSDIVCTIQEAAHDRFRRCGNDLYHTKSIDINQSLCGCAFPLKHLDNRTIAVRSKPGVVIRPGDMKVIKRQGMPILNSAAKGDLIVIFNVVFPARIDVTLVDQIKDCFPSKKTAEIPKDAEECDLALFDPKEQVYHVPFRQSSCTDESPMKNADTKPTNQAPTCAQQ